MSETKTRITQVGTVGIPVTDQDRIQLRPPDPKKKMPRLPKDSYAVVHKTALAVVPKKAPGITLNAYLDEMKKRLPKVRGLGPLRLRELVCDGDQARHGGERRAQAGQGQAAAAADPRVNKLDPNAPP